MTKLEKTTRVAADMQTLLRVLTDEETVVARELSRGALDAKVVAPVRDGSHYRYELHSTKYGRTMTGAEDKNKTQKQVSTYDWDMDAASCTFATDTGNGDRVKVEGYMKAKAVGDDSELTFGMSVDVRIPVVGKGIEKLVAREFNKAFPEFEEALRKGLPT